MPAHQTFQDRHTTTVSIERKLLKIAKALDIKLSDSLAAGLHFYVRMRIADSDHRLTSELLEEFKALEFKNIRELETYIRLKNEEQKTLDMVAESHKSPEKMRVFDRDSETYIYITPEQYHPDHHIIAPERTGGAEA